ncbi:MAG: 3-methyl-2-oxobutanoate hydroxymethyltransferase [Xanthomonadales bacterium]|nr:3-methyl-2-oxobutanoate hydroxymethyltransferase [Xanthomonadales bacterium]
MYSNLAPPIRALTIPELQARKAAAEPIAALTAYDASFARVVDEAEVDLVLVGDSLGNVIQGLRHTVSVRIEDVVYHTRAVSRGLQRALLMADMPFLAAANTELAIRNAARLMGEGEAAIVKIEGAGPMLEIMHFLVERDVPVCAHLGLTPQSVHRLGGYKVQGRDEAARQQLLADARAAQSAGASFLVLECVPSELAAQVTAALQIPTIGIGAGPDCDGQILVLHDVLGVASGRRPRFAKDYCGSDRGPRQAIAAYVQEVRQRQFPLPEHAY